MSEATKDSERGGLSRRRLMQGAAVAGVAAWLPFEQIPAAQAALPTPPTFPSGIPLYQQAYKNWSGEIAVDGVWTCTPNTPADVVTLANWARANGWRLRAKGSSHNWSPLSLAAGGSDAANVVLVDTTQADGGLGRHRRRRGCVPRPAPRWRRC